MEPSEGARGDQERTTAKGSQMSARRCRLFAAALLLAAAVPAAAQTSPTQTSPTQTSGTRAYVETLASEKFAGREAGSPGERLAADYIAAQLSRMGAQPLPGRSDMFVPFTFTAGSRDGGSRAVVEPRRSTRRRTSSHSPSPT